MTDIDVRLREDVHLLGELLGDTVREQYGEAFLQKIEDIRRSAKADRSSRRVSGAMNNGSSLPKAPAANSIAVASACDWPIQRSG